MEHNVPEGVQTILAGTSELRQGTVYRDDGAHEIVWLLSTDVDSGDQVAVALTLGLAGEIADGLQRYVEKWSAGG